MGPVLAPGSKLGRGRFRLIQDLGRGGMGMVWLALDTTLNERVAIKLLPPMLRADPASMEDVRKEVRLNRQLAHLNIVKVHDLCEDAQEPTFIFMEYVEGQTLTELRLRQPGGVFRWDQLVPWLAQLGDALDHAHRQKIIHRDLKPNNIMVDRQERVKLLDFGIARVMADSVTRLTMRQGTSGTLPYMSPQQLDGHPSRVTDDIYSMGATLYELLTSKPPFYHGDVHYQIRHLHPDPPMRRLEDLGMENPIPPEVENAILSCLQKDPALRPPAVPTVLQELGIAWERKSAVDRPVYVSPVQQPRLPGWQPAETPFRPALGPGPVTEPSGAPTDAAAAVPELEPECETEPGLPVDKAAWLSPILFLVDVGAVAILIYALLLPPPAPPPQPIRVSVTSIPDGARVQWRHAGHSEGAPLAEAEAGRCDLWPGEYELELSRAGYELLRTRVRLTEQPAATNLTFELAASPVPVMIGCIPSSIRPRIELGGEISTENPARFSVAPGDYRLSISSASHEPVAETIRIPPAGITNTYRLQEKPAAPAAGQLEVSFASRTYPSPLDVRIHAGREDLLVTNLAGYLPIRMPLPPGSYRLRIPRMDDGNVDEPFDIQADRMTRLVLSVAQIETRPSGATLVQNGINLTKTEGVRTLPRIEGKRLAFTARLNGYHDQAVEVSPQADSFTVVLRRLSHPVPGMAWTNSLGRVFHSITNLSDCWACIEETRMRDYAQFHSEQISRGNPVPFWNPVFEINGSLRPDSDHPAIRVSWAGARRFCEWLTAREHEDSRLDRAWRYRLPYDFEWSRAAGLDFEIGNSPGERIDLTKNPKRKRDIENHYPFGSWPPRMSAGNYSPNQGVDRYGLTSPVGSFSPNRYGLHDLGGNAWEFCEDFGASVVLRGGSFNSDGPDSLRTNYRLEVPATASSKDDWGFRVFLVRDR
ncbi:MAG TPA: bifunctional serine/threonine-protein kinase/formylglycine-generating enzyme family protein [Candidatus Paceibacterota bacterium]|nr:bifunctional serine/threonine-protein kinase/formylglycine-generating enzyme family protein [Candidatus Paceibacterota bacterium]